MPRHTDTLTAGGHKMLVLQKAAWLGEHWVHWLTTLLLAGLTVVPKSATVQVWRAG